MTRKFPTRRSRISDASQQMLSRVGNFTPIGSLFELPMRPFFLSRSLCSASRLVLSAHWHDEIVPKRAICADNTRKRLDCTTQQTTLTHTFVAKKTGGVFLPNWARATSTLMKQRPTEPYSVGKLTERTKNPRGKDRRNSG